MKLTPGLRERKPVREEIFDDVISFLCTEAEEIIFLPDAILINFVSTQ